MYIITNNGVYDDVLKMHIPNDINNRHWKIYQEWLADGNTPQNQTTVLSDYKTVAKREIVIASENKKLEFITSGAGKAMAYADKYEEAVDHKAAAYPTDLAPYPYINQESILTGDSGQVVTDRIIAAKTLCVDKFSQIEGHAFSGKANIDAAIDEAGVDSAKDTTISNINAV